MTPERRTEIIGILEEAKTQFCEALVGVTENAAAASPGPGRWSILQVVEHVTVAERGMLGAFARARPSDACLGNSAREKAISTRGTDRSSRFEAPEQALPTGLFATLAQALEQFVAAREQTMRFAGEHDGDLCFCTVKHPLFGLVNGYELLIIMAAHTRRHALQIQEIRSSPAE